MPHHPRPDQSGTKSITEPGRAAVTARMPQVGAASTAYTVRCRGPVRQAEVGRVEVPGALSGSRAPGSAGRVRRELGRVGLGEVGGPADGAPLAVLGQELLVVPDRPLGRGYAEGQVVGDVAAFGHLDEDLGRAYRVPRGTVRVLAQAHVDCADGPGVG